MEVMAGEEVEEDVPSVVELFVSVVVVVVFVVFVVVVVIVVVVVLVLLATAFNLLSQLLLQISS